MLLNRRYINYEAALQAVQQAIANYNGLRPHRSCGYLTPRQAHRTQGELVKKWRVSKRRRQGRMQPTMPTVAV